VLTVAVVVNGKVTLVDRRAVILLLFQ